MLAQLLALSLTPSLVGLEHTLTAAPFEELGSYFGPVLMTDCWAYEVLGGCYWFNTEDPACGCSVNVSSDCLLFITVDIKDEHYRIYCGEEQLFDGCGCCSYSAFCTGVVAPSPTTTVECGASGWTVEVYYDGWTKFCP